MKQLTYGIIKEFEDGTMIVGHLTYADKDYIYGEFLYNREEDLLINFRDISSYEIKYES